MRTLGDGTVEIGITDHAQHALGDLVFVEVPEAGRAVKAGEACAVVESVKAASDVYAPLSRRDHRRQPEARGRARDGQHRSLRRGLADAHQAGARGARRGAALMSAADYQKLLDAEGG